MARVAIVGVLLTALVVTASAQAPAPAYVAVGDSIDFGLGDNILADGFGYVPLVAGFLTSFFGQPVQTSNFAVPFSLARDVRQGQLRAALAAAQGHAPVVVSWGGGVLDRGLNQRIREVAARHDAQVVDLFLRRLALRWLRAVRVRAAWAGSTAC